MSAKGTQSLTSARSPKNFSGTCTAKFLSDGEHLPIDFEGSSFVINYGSLFPKRINYIHIGDTVDGGRYFDFTIDPPRGDGTYPIPLTSSNARFTYNRYGFNIVEGDLILTVTNGNCTGNFKLKVTGNPSGGGEETLSIEEGVFDIYAI